MRGIRFAKRYKHLDAGEREIEVAVRAAARIAANVTER
jgi:hypothetical protein